MPKYLLLPATEADRDCFQELHELCYRDLVERQFGEWDANMQREFFEARWSPSNYQKVIIDGKTVGCLEIYHHSDDIFFSEIQLAPEIQGNGVGTCILRNLQADATKAKIPIRLQVLRLNRAITLYIRLGFLIVDETDTHVHLEWNA